MSEVLMAALGVQVKSLGRQLAEVTAKNAALTEENARVRALLTEFDQRHAADQAELAALRRAPVSAGKVKAIAEAGQAYADAAIKFHGEFANMTPPQGEETR
jgi:regulator of replication initiation timing